MTRTFRLVAVDGNNNYNIDLSKGIYKGQRPAQAALKAFNWYCRKTGNESCILNFLLEEIDPPGKTYRYKGTRRRLSPPKAVKREGKTYLIHYESVVHTTF